MRKKNAQVMQNKSKIYFRIDLNENEMVDLSTCDSARPFIELKAEINVSKTNKTADVLRRFTLMMTIV